MTVKPEVEPRLNENRQKRVSTLNSLDLILGDFASIEFCNGVAGIASSPGHTVQ
jgi:hypothetical protein